MMEVGKQVGCVKSARTHLSSALPLVRLRRLDALYPLHGFGLNDDLIDHLPIR